MLLHCTQPLQPGPRPGVPWRRGLTVTGMALQISPKTFMVSDLKPQTLHGAHRPAAPKGHTGCLETLNKGDSSEARHFSLSIHPGALWVCPPPLRLRPEFDHPSPTHPHAEIFVRHFGQQFSKGSPWTLGELLPFPTISMRLDSLRILQPKQCIIIG